MALLLAAVVGAGCTVDRQAAWPSRVDGGGTGPADGGGRRDTADGGAVRCRRDEDCDDGRFCNGSERCDVAAGRCVPGTPPCVATTGRCDEDRDQCVACTLDEQCDDDDFCNGAEKCQAGSCVPGTPPCPDASGNRLCDAEGRRCVACLEDEDCDDGRFCNGREACDEAAGRCLDGSPPCASDVGCDEASGRCIACVTDSDCGTPPSDCQRWNCVAGRCETIQRSDGTRCDDGQRCTYDDQCRGGVCQGTAVSCATGSCSETSGCNLHPCEVDSDCGAICDEAWCGASLACLIPRSTCLSTPRCADVPGISGKVCSCCVRSRP